MNEGRIDEERIDDAVLGFERYEVLLVESLGRVLWFASGAALWSGVLWGVLLFLWG